MRSFALTLQFYSTKAYEFVRQTFDLALPTQSQIRRWYRKIAADPGFTEPALNALKAKVADAERNGKKVIGSLMMDQIAIKKHIHGMARNTMVTLILVMMLTMTPYQ